MRIFTAILLGLLWWTAPAGAQTIHSLTVSIHEEVVSKLSPSDVKKILADASSLLQTQEDPQDVSCNVGFALKGEVGKFSSAPAVINTAADLDAVHSVPADVKVVQQINFCMGKFMTDGFLGCAWRPEGRPKTVIVKARMGDGVAAPAWAHEYGHTTGLLHRQDKDGFALMTPCALQPFRKHVNKVECDHFIAGPVTSYPPGDGDTCP
jgi:hypothetical protein